MIKLLFVHIGVVLVLLASGFVEDTETAELKYIESHQRLAIAEMQLYGIPASITLAQALVESDAGRSVLAKRANNHFGIKCKSWWTGGKYFYADDDRDHTGQLTPSCFRIYSSAEESFRDHSDFLKYSDRYNPLFLLNLQDYSGWARGLQQCGYATDRKYGDRLIQKIEKYNLSRLDNPIEH